MRSSILLLAAASLLVAAQAAPISSEAQATSTPAFAQKCSKESDGTWFCYGENSVNPKAASIDFRTGDCLKIKNEWVCPGKALVGGAESEAASIEPEAITAVPPRRCFKVDGVWECYGGGYDPRSVSQVESAELEAIDSYLGGSSPSRLPCHIIRGEMICPDIKK